MKMKIIFIMSGAYLFKKWPSCLLTLLALAAWLSACQPGPEARGGRPEEQAAEAASPTTSIDDLEVLAVETFLADIAQNVAGERVEVQALVPIGLDPHAFQPAPRDIARVADSELLIVVGSGFEEWLNETLENAGGQRQLIEASAGLESRQAHEGEEAAAEDEEHHESGDPHFWLDPLSVIRFVENIRTGLIQVDPAGREIYTRNAEAYIAELVELDGWIREQVEAIPAEDRLMVTNHESFGYFADRYGFRILGAIIPSVSTEASPSAQELAGLIERIRAEGAQAIFLETGANPRLAEQIAAETGVKVVTGLYTHSITEPGGPAPSYLEMMRANTRAIVSALSER
jgi:ABC-type Zn uptake system ZnuABC Zn-binding protein ZnuA